jgi:hypothetical protein
VVAVFPPVAADDLNAAVVPLDRKLEPDDVVAGPNLVEDAAWMIGPGGGFVKHLIHLAEEAVGRFGLAIRLRVAFEPSMEKKRQLVKKGAVGL